MRPSGPRPDARAAIGQVYVEQARFILPVALSLFIPLGCVEAAAEHTFELETEDLDAGSSDRRARPGG